MSRRVLSVVLLAIVLPSSLVAQESAWGVYVDQDVLWEPAEDKDYTMGLQFNFQGEDWGAGILRWLDRRFDLLRLSNSEWDPSFHFGVSAFAPRKEVLELPEPQIGDRPYASLLYVRWRGVHTSGRNAIRSEFTFGMLGLGISDAVQTWIHANVSNDVAPGGWSNQISNGGGWRALTGAYKMGYSRLLVGREDVSAQNFSWGDFSVTAEGSAGYYTMGRIGMTGRFGRVISKWSTTRDFLSGSPPELSDSSAGEMAWELYAWLTWGEQAWLYNSLLQGQGDPDDAVTLSFDAASVAPMRRNVSDFSIGLAARLGRVSAQWTIMAAHTPLFDGPYSRNHSWGSIALAYHLAPSD